MKKTLYLIVNIDTEEAWTVKRRPSPKFGQFYYTLCLDIPDAWFGEMGDIELKLPNPPKDVVQIKEALGL